MESTRSSSSSLNSPSRSKRSTANLANLRLAPLSSHYVDTGPERKRSVEVASDATFARSHSSYLQGKSAPTTPGILSRNSSRRHLHGLSRRSSLYDNEPTEVVSYEYAGVVRDNAGGVSVEITPGRMPKAKSEAALLVQRNKIVQQGIQARKTTGRHHSRRASGTGSSTTPRLKSRAAGGEDDWVSRTGAAANAILQESKGQSWLSSRPSSTSFTHLQDTTDEEDDEGYEEMAALSTSTTKDQPADDELTPVHTRTGGWGSRYGSRGTSRRTSRRGSLTAGSRTPLVPLTNIESGGVRDEDPHFALLPVEPDFVDSEEELDSQDEAAVARIADEKSFGFGGIVDRLMHFNLFKVEEKEETTDDEAVQTNETETQAAERRAMENRRKKAERDKLTNRPVSGTESQGEGQVEGGWSDAAWLLSVASKVIF